MDGLLNLDFCHRLILAINRLLRLENAEFDTVRRNKKPS